MALSGMIFDLDGTLLDTNWAHIEAWRRAFASCGYQVPSDRIAVEIGKGGDLLVSAVLGQQAEDKDGDTLRHRSEEEFLKIAGSNQFKVFPGTQELLTELRRRGIRTALATSSKVKHLQAMFQSAGADISKWVDELLTADDAETSKPAPDLVISAAQKLKLSVAECAMVGDTPYDARAARHAGVVALGVLTGDNPPDVLRQAGARALWKDVADMREHLDEALTIASPGLAHLSKELLETLMREAIQEARSALAAGEKPVGSIVAGGDGTIVSRAGQETHRRRDRTAHAPLLALARGAEALPASRRDAILVSTAEPCVMCLGAAEQWRVDTVVFGVAATKDGAAERIVPPTTAQHWLPRMVGKILEDETRELLRHHHEQRRT